MSTWHPSITQDSDCLLAWSRPAENQTFALVSARLIQLGVSGGSIDIACIRCGLNESKGSFGVLLAHGAMDLWESECPVDGDPSTANSIHPELAGYAATLGVLLMFKSLNPSFSDPNFSLRPTTWIDSAAAGKFIGKC